MPKIEINSLIKQLRGTLYEDLVFKLSPQGELIVTKRPDMTKVKWSKKQKAHRKRFKQAVEHTKAALADSAVRAKYERLAKKQGKRPWDVAFSDHFHGKDLLAKK